MRDPTEPPRTTSGMYAAAGATPDELAADRAALITEGERLLALWRANSKITGSDEVFSSIARVYTTYAQRVMSNRLLQLTHASRRR